MAHKAHKRNHKSKKTRSRKRKNTPKTAPVKPQDTASTELSSKSSFVDQAFTAFLTLALFGWAICCLAILVFRTVDAIKTNINMGSGLAVALNLWLIASLVIEGYMKRKGPNPIHEAQNEAESLANEPATPNPSDIHHAKVQDPPSNASGYDTNAKNQLISEDIGPLRSADSKTNQQPDKTSLAAHKRDGTKDMIKSYSGQPDTTDADSIPAESTTTETNPTKTSTTETISAATVSSSTAGNKVAPNTTATTNSTTKSTPPTAKRRGSAFGDDSYLILAQVLMLNAMRAAPAVRREICSKMTGLFMAVPFWMLDFGAAHNPGCSAQAGLDAFKSVFNGKNDMDGILAVLDDSDKLQSMGLLLRTFTAASVQQDLDNILCGSDHWLAKNRLLAEDILHMTPEANMPEFCREVPHWH